MNGIVDRIEGNILVIEVDDKIYNFNIEGINLDIKEGDVVEVILEDDRIISIKKNNIETQKRKEYIQELTKDMWE